MLEGREALLSLGSRAVLAVPIVIFDELIGVLALHRTTPGRWGDDEIALTEAVPVRSDWPCALRSCCARTNSG